MQSAETVLDVIRERGRRGLPLERLYRQLFNPQLFLLAYGRIYSNQGAMTPGVTGETVDGMSLAQDRARSSTRCAQSRYRWSPAQAGLHPEEEREETPAGPAAMVGQTGRRGGPSAAWRRTTTSQFSDRSHGFRPGRGCHTALDEVVSAGRERLVHRGRHRRLLRES